MESLASIDDSPFGMNCVRYRGRWEFTLVR